MNWFIYQLRDGHWVVMENPKYGGTLGYITYQAAEYAFACLGFDSETHCINKG